MSCKVGILGGTFDPVHLGHLIMASYALDEFNLDKIVFVPNGNPPHKTAKSYKEHRLNMTKFVTSYNKKFEVCDFEILKDEPSYTIDTVRHLKNNGDEIYFIIGADSFYYLETWRNFDELKKECYFIAFDRISDIKTSFEDDIKKFNEKYDAKVLGAKMPFIDISSTTIRNRVKNKKSIEFLTLKEVENYIFEHNLYSEKEE